jgi:hypothetical protein
MEMPPDGLLVVAGTHVLEKESDVTSSLNQLQTANGGAT